LLFAAHNFFKSGIYICSIFLKVKLFFAPLFLKVDIYMRSYKKGKGRGNKKSKNRSRKQFYNMKGCSNNKCLGGGGGTSLDISKVYPSKGETGPYPGWINPSVQNGGGQKGGCNCQLQHGGYKYGGQRGGNNGLPYGRNLPFMKNPVVPNGLTGKPWEANFKWPGVNGVSGDYNHYSLNKYMPDVVTAIKNVGANFPFLNGGSKRNGSKRNGSKRKKSVKRGGGFSNSLAQDLITGGQNLIYQNDKFMAGIQGKMAPSSPLPYDQPKMIK
jgi:hypothetical protein